jgi:uncharacterized repeat protein (TIGR01451 family)
MNREKCLMQTLGGCLRTLNILVVLTAMDAMGQSWTRSSTVNMYGGSVASSHDGIKLLAAQFNGPLYSSTNAGVTWRQIPTPTGRAWTDVASSANGSNLVAVAFYSPIYISKNAGFTWTATSSPSLPWVSVASSTDGNVLLAATYDSNLYLSTNGGTSWMVAAEPAYWGPVTCSADGTKLIAVNDGDMVTSSNGGATWTTITNGPGNPIALASSADATKLIAAANDKIYLSTDSGVTWLAASNVPTKFWEAVAASADGTILTAVADGGSIYTSPDSGITWHSNNAPSAQWSTVASSASGSRLIAGCNLGIYTLPGYDLGLVQFASPPIVSPGSNITFTINVTNQGPEDAKGVMITTGLSSAVNFVSATPAWTSNAGVFSFSVGAMTNGATATISIEVTAGSTGLGTNSATVSSTFFDRESTNNTFGAPFGIALSGFKVWEKRSPTTSPWWQGIAASANGDKIVVAGGYGGAAMPIYTSKNGGLTWETNSSTPSSQWTCVASSADGQVLVAGGWNTSLYISTNAGAVWTQSSSIIGEWLSVAASADGRVILGGNYGNVLAISTNSGATWGTAAFPGYWGPVVASSNGSRLIACNQGVMHTSFDTGATWTQVTNLPMVVASTDCSADGSRIIASPSNNGGGNSGMLHFSTDFGASWSVLTNSPNLLWVGVASSGDGRVLAATTYYGSIYTSRDYGVTWNNGLVAYNSWGDVAVSADGTTLAAVGQGGVYVSRPPALFIERSGTNTVTVSWPSLTWEFGLQQNLDLSGPNWQDVVAPVADKVGLRQAVVNTSADRLFLRMRQ